MGLWVLARALRARWMDFEQVAIRLLAARICRTLQQQGVSLGQFTLEGDFDEWPADVAVDRMLIEWSDLGRDPDMGEVAWLRRR